MANNAAGHGHSHGGAGGFTPAENGHSHMVPALPAEYYEMERKAALAKAEKESAKKGGQVTYGSVSNKGDAVVATEATNGADNAEHHGHGHGNGDVAIHMPPDMPNGPEPIPLSTPTPLHATVASAPTSPVATSSSSSSPVPVVAHSHGHGHGGHGHSHGAPNGYAPFTEAPLAQYARCLCRSHWLSCMSNFTLLFCSDIVTIHQH
jgi:zinc transporter 1